MSAPPPGPGARPSQLKAPSRLARPCTVLPKTSGLPAPKPTNLASTPSGSSVILTENTDDFIIGDRVYVGGTKPGHIQYIGETQFAPGEWAGVVLDEPVGKNDGSLAGVRYFQCEPKRGVFSRLTKLTKERLIGRDDDDDASVKANGSVRSTSPRPGSSSSRLAQARSSTPSSLSGDGGTPKLRVNDRVQVTSASGTKYGTVRYLGLAEFAVGEWAGVELDEAGGKNDGAVAGKRYFTCAPRYGLFAPIHKVAKFGTTRRPVSGNLSSLTPSATTPRRSISGTPRRAGSQESISTIGSSSSAARGSKTRLGINSLTTSGTKPSRSSATNMSATQTAMQEALKEKEQHIEQLLRERDLERSELARGASQVEEVEQELTALRNEHQRFKEEAEHSVAMYREIAEATDKRRKELENLLEEERKKLEDMVFRLEEESISLSEVEKERKVSQASKEADLEQIASLEQALADEKKRADNLELECNAQFQREETLAKCKEEMDRLQNSLHDAEQNVESLHADKSLAGEKIKELTEELIVKISQVTDYEELLNAKEANGAKLNDAQVQLEKQLHENHLHLEKQEEKIAELSSKLLASEDTIKTINLQIGELQISCADLKRKLQASDDRCEQLVQQKSQLESDIAEQMKTSGSSSEQVSRMNNQLREKEKLLENLQQEFQSAIQDRQRLEDILEQKNKAQKEIEAALGQSRESCSALEKKLMESQTEWLQSIEALKSELDEKNEELTLTSTATDSEKSQLRSSLEEHRQRVSVLDAQLDELKRNIENTSRSNDESRVAFEQKMSEVGREVEQLRTDKHQLTTSLASLENEKVTLAELVQQLQREKQESSSAVVEKERSMTVLNQEVDLLKSKLSQYQSEWSSHQEEQQRKLAENKAEDAAAQDQMKRAIETIQKDMEEQQQNLQEARDERDMWKAEAEKAATIVQRAKQLEDNVFRLQKELEVSKDRLLQNKNNLESEKDELQKMLETSKIVLDQRETEMHKNREEIENLKQKAAAVIDTKDRLDALQQENVKYVQKVALLNAKIASLENRLSENTLIAKNGESTLDDKESEKLVEERDALASQVEFLNKIIVDMHKKNDELLARLEILEAGGEILNDFSDVNLNDVKTKVALRLYCDICQTFDVHDTEDCPTQASSDSPPPTKYHGTRRQERPFCETCDVFGHWTNECDDNETF